jgi:hypothetical protein
MAQAVCRRSVTTEARVRAPASPCGIYGLQNGSGRGFSQSSSVLSCQYHSTETPYLYITSRMSNNRPVGGHSSDIVSPDLH